VQPSPHRSCRGENCGYAAAWSSRRGNEIRRRRPQRTVIVAHADRRAQDHALRETVLHLGREIDDFTAHAWYESVDDGDTRSRQGFMDLTDIPLPQDIQVFTCGPLSFMRHVRSTLLSRGVPPARIRYEVFGPDLWAAQTSSDSGS
jgi:nitric oxide dioxygenase